MKGNYHYLDDSEIKLFNNKYYFEYPNDNLIIVGNNGYGRKTAKDINEAFNLLVKDNNKTYYLTITPLAIKYHKNELSDYSLFDIQNGINKIMILSQDITLENIKHLIIKN